MTSSENVPKTGQIIVCRGSVGFVQHEELFFLSGRGGGLGGIVSKECLRNSVFCAQE